MKDTLERENDLLAKLELINAIQRLGLQYHFDNEIKKALQVIQNHSNDSWLFNDLHSTALRFRLLRQHGYDVSQGIMFIIFHLTLPCGFAPTFITKIMICLYERKLF